MTVSRLLSELDRWELMEWQAFFMLENTDRQKAQDAAELKSRMRSHSPRRR